MGSPSRLSLGGWGAEGWASSSWGNPEAGGGSSRTWENLEGTSQKVWELCPQGHVGTWPLHTSLSSLAQLRSQPSKALPCRQIPALLISG